MTTSNERRLYITPTARPDELPCDLPHRLLGEQIIWDHDEGAEHVHDLASALEHICNKKHINKSDGVLPALKAAIIAGHVLADYTPDNSMPTYPVCENCLSDNVVADATAWFNTKTNDWELSDTQDAVWCNGDICGGSECGIFWLPQAHDDLLEKAAEAPVLVKRWLKVSLDCHPESDSGKAVIAHVGSYQVMVDDSTDEKTALHRARAQFAADYGLGPDQNFLALRFQLVEDDMRPELTPQEQFGGIWGEHPGFPKQDWQTEVNNGDTVASYWDWVTAGIEAFKLTESAGDAPE